MDKEMLSGALEALLFASGKPVSVKTLCEILEKEKGEIVEAAQNLEIKLIERNVHRNVPSGPFMSIGSFVSLRETKL